MLFKIAFRFNGDYTKPAWEGTATNVDHDLHPNSFLLASSKEVPVKDTTFFVGSRGIKQGTKLHKCSSGY